MCQTERMSNPRPLECHVSGVGNGRGGMRRSQPLPFCDPFQPGKFHSLDFRGPVRCYGARAVLQNGLRTRTRQPPPMSSLERYARFLVRRAPVVVLVVLLATAGMFAGIRRLRAEFSIDASLPQGHPFVEIDRQIRTEFGGRNTMIVAVVPREGDVWRPEVLEVVQRLTFDALELEDVMAQNVVSLAAPSVRYPEDRGGTISVGDLRNEVPRTPEDIAALRARLQSDPQLDGMLVTRDQRAALVLLDFWPSASAEDVFGRTTRLVEPYRDRPLDFYFAGEPVLAMSDKEQSRAVAVRIPFTFLVIALMLLLSFRSLQGMFVPMLTATLSTVWGLGLMGFTGVVIDGWNVAVPILLIAVAAAHSAQMLKRYGEEVARSHDNRDAVIRSTVAMGPVMVAAGLTAALGFASLALFGVRSIGNFGLSCSYGIASAVLLEMTFIPALRALLPAPRRVPGEGGPTHAFLSFLARGILGRRGRGVVVAAALVLALAVAGALRIRTYGSARDYMPRGGLARTHLEAIEQHFQGTVTMTVLYVGPPGSVRTLEVVRHEAALQEALARDPLVERTASLAGLYVVTPIAAAVVFLFGFIGWTGIRLDMGSASVIAMATGIGADYAIYFLYRLREERARLGNDEAAFGEALHTSGRAVLFVAASIGAGFGVMAFSPYLGLWLFGTLMPLAMAVSCVAALSIMPVMVLRMRPAFVFGRAARAEPGAAAARRAAG